MLYQKCQKGEFHMKFTKTAKLLTSLALAVIMIASLIVPAMAYQSAFKKGADVTAFSQTAKDKMAAMKDGDNIFALGEYDTATYNTAAKYTESGLCQFVYQHTDNKWGRALNNSSANGGSSTWAIDGMAKVGDGIIDGTIGYKKDGVMYFGIKESTAALVNANAETDKSDSKYYTLAGWEFAADFRVKGFKIYFGQSAYADDFDILVGHVEGDGIVWEVAFEGNNMKSKFTSVSETINALYSFEASFDRVYSGRFIQLATKSFDGTNTELRNGYNGYVCTEFEVYSTCVNHSMTEGVCTKCGALASGSDISTAAQFAKMVPGGTYNITADFTVSESYDGFTGVINGNGHTITATAPLFYTFNGTISDLTVDANITSARTATGAVAEYAESIIAENVTVTGSVTNTVGDAGGIVGNAASAKFDGCENYADVTAKLNAGGLAGKVGNNTTSGKGVKCADCANYGDITSTATSGGTVGGIVGWVGAKNNSFVSTFDSCANYGDVTGASSSSYPAAGIVAYVYGTAGKSYPVITDCLNSGDITNNSTNANSFASQIVGYCNCINTTLNKCFCLGTTTAEGGQTVVCGVSSAVPTDFANINVYFYGEEGTNYAPEFFTWSNGTADNRLALAAASDWGEDIEVTAEQFASGEVACDINTKAGKILVGQNIDNGETADAKPVLNGAKVYDLGEGKYSNYENGAAPAPTFAAQVAVGENISIILTVNTDAAVTVKDADGNDIALTVESADGPYVYRIYDITPQMMSDVFTISVEGADSVEFSIRDYCMSVLEKCEDEDICNFVENLLHYGAAAQVWADYNTENLADASLSAAAAPKLLTSTDKKWVANREYDGNVKVTAAGMYFDFQNSLYFKTSGEGVVTYKVNGGDAVNAATVDGAIGGIFAELSITELAQVYEVAVYDNGTLVGTLTYSGLSFIYSNQSKSGARGDFAKSMLNLYYSAMALIAE